MMEGLTRHDVNQVTNSTDPFTRQLTTRVDISVSIEKNTSKVSCVSVVALAMLSNISESMAPS